MEYYITDYQINGRQYRMGNQNGQYRETGNIGYTRPKQHNMHWTQLLRKQTQIT
jgi:hypothetical protein